MFAFDACEALVAVKAYDADVAFKAKDDVVAVFAFDACEAEVAVKA